MMDFYGSAILKSHQKHIKALIASVKTVMGMLSEEGCVPARQIAIDDDWSALRFEKHEKNYENGSYLCRYR
jgi:hypothetical protein